MGCWSNGKTLGLHPGNRGSTPRRSTCRNLTVSTTGPHRPDAAEIREPFGLTPVTTSKADRNVDGFQLSRPASVMDGMADFESAGRGSIPRRGTEHDCPGSVPDCTRAREARRPGSIPGWDTDWTLEPDGEAAGCNPAEVGSIPTGVSGRLMRSSDSNLLVQNTTSKPYLRWKVAVPETQLARSP